MTTYQHDADRDAPLNPEQEMWVELLAAMLSQKSFNMELGDLGYVFRNAIAKMISSSHHYWISSNAEQLVLQSGLDLNVPIHTKKLFYGSNSKFDTIFEHIVPVGIIAVSLFQNREIKNNKKNVEKWIRGCGGVTVMTRTEDRALNKAGLGRKMPDGWILGDDPFKRYDAANIDRPRTKLKSIGPICR